MMSKRRQFDWAAIMERLKRIQETPDLGVIVREDRDRILKKRAEELALPLHEQEISRRRDSVVIFRAGPDRFALPLSDLVEVVSNVQVAAVPRAPAELAGLMQIRGEIRPIYYLRRLLGQTHDTSESLAIVLLVRHPTGDFGIGVHSVEEIRSVPQDARRPGTATRGHAGWATVDLIPCLAVDSLLEREG